MPQQVVIKKRVPQSRLVKPKPAQPTATPRVVKEPAPIRPQTVAQSAIGGAAKSRLLRNEQAPRQAPPPLEDAAEELPAERMPEDDLPANDLPANDLPDDGLPAETPPNDALLNEPAREPETEPEVQPLDEPSPNETEPLDLNQPAPPSTAEPQPEPEALPAPSGAIYRLEPPSKLVPVGVNELKPGVIYLHEDSRAGRQVWSFVQANGQFWHAFGPGTTQALVHFDLRMTEEEALEELRKIDPKLAFNVTNQGTRVFLRLQADNTWKLVRTSSVPSIFDLETNQRWEMQWDRYLPVTHNCGDTWAYRDGQYWAPQWDESMRPN
jgi:hypothetical protein